MPYSLKSVERDSKRLRFSAAIKRIEAGKADVIVVADHGRLLRP